MHAIVLSVMLVGVTGWSICVGMLFLVRIATNLFSGKSLSVYSFITKFATGCQALKY